MSLKIDTKCLLCHFRRNLEVARSLGSEEQAMAFARDLMQLYLDSPTDVPSPWFNPKAEELIRRHYDVGDDRFAGEKALSNRFVLERLEQIREKIRGAADPVFAGLQFAILGNYLDFGALQGQVSFETLEGMLSSALEMELDREVYQDFCRSLEQGRSLLYLTDNAGEIGFDRLFAEELARKYPNLAITFCVRGQRAINDATRADAEAVGLPFPVIDNGNDIPGTWLPDLGQEAREALEQADVIFAKGMANCETLHGCGYPIYYAFLVKCQRFVDIFQKELMTPMLVEEG